MKFQIALIVGALLLSVSVFAGSAESDNAGTAILRAQNIAQLRDIAGAARFRLIRIRGCKIQRRERVPPTLCYSDEVKDPRELDSLCLSFSLRAAWLPKVDHYTSKACRDAIERRGKDLAYVTRDNDQRNALR